MEAALAGGTASGADLAPAQGSAVITNFATAVPETVTDGEITVSVRSEGPLRTTLTARRTPGRRYPELLIGALD
jgi:hypothetical protein